MNQMEKIRIHIDSSGFNNKPKDYIGLIKPRLQSDKNIHEIEINNLPNPICDGYTISPAIMKDGCKSSNWLEQKLFMVDIDNENIDYPILDVDNALKICEEHKLNPIFYYYTYSHTNNKPKYRLCFVMDELINDIGKRNIIMEVLINLFNQSDKSGINADRIFFGTNKGYKEVDFNNRITLDNIIINWDKLPEKQQINNCTDTNLSTLKKNFDFYNYLIERNGEPIYKTTIYAKFYECELCGHKNDLVYYFGTNSFMCFSSSLGKGGSIVDYIKILNQCTTKDAINYFKYEILSLHKESNNKNGLVKNNKIIEKIELLNITENYSFDDKGISKLFSDIFKNSCRFNTTANEWYYYNGKVWIEDIRGMYVLQKAKIFYDNLIIYCASIQNDAIRDKLLKYVIKLGQYKARQTLINDSKDVNFISYKDLDKNDDLLNCQNGTLNIKTLEFTKHNPDDLLSKICNVKYRPNIKAKRYLKFLKEIFENDEEKIKYLQIILGYSLTADTSLEECYILLGKTTRNGKSTLNETIAYMLGNNDGYAMNIMPETLAIKFNKDSRTASGDIARLNNCRFLSTSEPPKNMLIDNAFLKTITGRDRITARHLQQKEIEFIPKFKLFINTNHLPYITDKTLFDSNRINIISFNKHFNENEQDINLKDKLKTDDELSGILNWCLEGLYIYYQNKMITKPKCIVEDINLFKKQSNKINEYIEDRLVKSNKNLKIKDVYIDYKNWCQEMGISCEYKSNFIQEIKDMNIFSDCGTINGKTEKNIIVNYSFSNGIMINDI